MEEVRPHVAGASREGGWHREVDRLEGEGGGQEGTAGFDESVADGRCHERRGRVCRAVPGCGQYGSLSRVSAGNSLIAAALGKPGTDTLGTEKMGVDAQHCLEAFLVDHLVASHGGHTYSPAYYQYDSYRDDAWVW